MNLVSTREKDNRKMTSYTYDWMGKKDRNDLGSQT